MRSKYYSRKNKASDDILNIRFGKKENVMGALDVYCNKRNIDKNAYCANLLLECLLRNDVIKEYTNQFNWDDDIEVKIIEYLLHYFGVDDIKSLHKLFNVDTTGDVANAIFKSKGTIKDFGPLYSKLVLSFDGEYVNAIVEENDGYVIDVLLDDAFSPECIENVFTENAISVLRTAAEETIITLVTAKENAIIYRLIEKLGFVDDGELKQYFDVNTGSELADAVFLPNDDDSTAELGVLASRIVGLLFEGDLLEDVIEAMDIIEIGDLLDRHVFNFDTLLNILTPKAITRLKCLKDTRVDEKAA